MPDGVTHVQPGVPDNYSSRSTPGVPAVQVDQYQVDSDRHEVENLEDVLHAEPFHPPMEGLADLNKKDKNGRSCEETFQKHHQKFNIKLQFLFLQGLGFKKVIPIVRQNTVQNQSPLMQSLSTALYVVECIKARQERKVAKMNLKMQMRIMTMAHLLYCIMMNTLIIGWVRIFLFLRSIGVTLEKLRSLAGLMSRWIIKSSSWSGHPLLRK